MTPTATTTVSQQVYVARYLSADDTGGFSTIGLGVSDRALEVGQAGAPCIPDVGIGVVISATEWQPPFAAGRITFEVVGPSGTVTPLGEVDGHRAFGGGTPGQPFRVTLAVQHREVPTDGSGVHQVRVTTTVGDPGGGGLAAIVTNVELVVHPADDDGASAEGPPPPGALGYL